MATYLQPWKREIFHFNPAKPSSAVLGRCSYCWHWELSRRAKYALIGNANRPIAALCEMHARLNGLNKQTKSLRYDIRYSDYEMLRIVQ